MARLAGVDLPPNKRAEIGLTYIYGIGRSRSKTILDAANVDIHTKIRDLTEEELNRIRAVIDQHGKTLLGQPFLACAKHHLRLRPAPHLTRHQPACQ